MNINSAFPSRYLRASDLKGQSPIVTISHVTMEVVGGKDQRPVVYFENKEKGLILNKTNARTIAQIAETSEMDDWAGIVIQLFVAQIEYQGDVVDAIRVRRPHGSAAPRSVGKPKPVMASDAEPDDFEGDDAVPF